MNGDSSEGLRKSKSYVTVLKDLKPGSAFAKHLIRSTKEASQTQLRSLLFHINPPD